MTIRTYFESIFVSEALFMPCIDPFQTQTNKQLCHIPDRLIRALQHWHTIVLKRCCSVNCIEQNTPLDRRSLTPRSRRQRPADIEVNKMMLCSLPLIASYWFTWSFRDASLVLSSWSSMIALKQYWADVNCEHAEGKSAVSTIRLINQTHLDLTMQPGDMIMNY